MFYIIDQGLRIQTPVETLARDKTVQAIEKPAATSAISKEQEVPIPKQPPKQNPAQPNADKLAHHYQENKQASQQRRQPAVFATQIMTRPAIAMNDQESIYSASLLLKRQRFHHLPIINKNGELIGIVTDRDMMRFSLDNSLADLRSITVSRIMNKKVITAAEETEIRSIADVMCRQNISAMPITDQNRRLIGIVSSTDILRTLVHQAPLELWA
ncbi:HPP family protein [Dasania marina]|uniref:CBS domain-containing protein n=1 Tax=Dasania marina TaxID=471499 RepID=UPI0004B41839|nr:CBS domain-containing protein [Dasania marina]